MIWVRFLIGAEHLCFIQLPTVPSVGDWVKTADGRVVRVKAIGWVLKERSVDYVDVELA